MGIPLVVTHSAGLLTKWLERALAIDDEQTEGHHILANVAITVALSFNAYSSRYCSPDESLAIAVL
jgi:hypothetical protein